jgi:hypothetical protein
MVELEFLSEIAVAAAGISLADFGLRLRPRRDGVSSSAVGKTGVVQEMWPPARCGWCWSWRCRDPCGVCGPRQADPALTLGVVDRVRRIWRSTMSSGRGPDRRAPATRWARSVLRNWGSQSRWAAMELRRPQVWWPLSLFFSVFAMASPVLSGGWDLVQDAPSTYL